MALLIIKQLAHKTYDVDSGAGTNTYSVMSDALWRTTTTHAASVRRRQ